jgi:hypothetical protein
MMNAEEQVQRMEDHRVGWAFWLQWVAVTMVGSTVGGTLVGALMWTGDAALIASTSLLLFGICVGLGQWLILRQRIHKAGLWVAASLAGWTIGGITFQTIYWVVETIAHKTMGSQAILAVVYGFVVGGVVGLIVGGFSVGIAQWFILRIQMNRAGWWVLASTVSWGTGLAASAAAGVFSSAPDWIVGGAILGAIGGLVAGAISGIVLVWLLRQPVTTADSE